MLSFSWVPHNFPVVTVVPGCHYQQLIQGDQLEYEACKGFSVLQTFGDEGLEPLKQKWMEDPSKEYLDITDFSWQWLDGRALPLAQGKVAKSIQNLRG